MPGRASSLALLAMLLLAAWSRALAWSSALPGLGTPGVFLPWALAVLGAAAGVLATYALATAFFGPGVGLGAALFLAVAHPTITSASRAGHDALLALATVVAMFAVSRLWPLRSEARAGQEPRPADTVEVRATLLAGAACGAAAALHPFAGFLAMPLAVALWRKPNGLRPASRVTALAIGCLSFGVLWLALAPVLAPSDPWWRRDVIDHGIEESAAVAPGLPAADAIWRGLRLWTEAATGPVLLWSLWGLWATWRLSRHVGMLLSSFPLAFFLALAWAAPAHQPLSPLLPFTAVLGSFGVHDGVTRLVPRWRRFAVAAVTIVAALPGLFSLTRFVR